MTDTPATPTLITQPRPVSQPRGNMFASDLPRFQVAWDSTSLGLIKECPRKYYYQIVLGWRSKRESVHLKFGQLYHAGLEGYDHACADMGKLDGNLTDDEHDAAILAAIRRAFSLAGEHVPPHCLACEGTGYISADDFLSAPAKCELCHGTGQMPDAPPRWMTWQSTDPNKNMWTLTRSLINYCDHFRSSPMRTVLLSNGKPAIELSFLFEAGTIRGITYAFCGHLDRIAYNKQDGSETPAPHDRKTTKGQLNTNYWRGFSPHNQFSLYNVACAVHYQQPSHGLVVDAAQILVGSSHFARQFIPFPPQVISEWLREAEVWIDFAYRYAEANFWPRNDKSCGNYGGCPFIKVCSKGESHRQSWLEADFRHDPWNPLQTRGDV